MSKERQRGKTKRRLERAAMLDEIRGMSDEDLKNLASEIGREMNVQSSIVNTLRTRLETVRAERERRRVATTNGVHVSDHAVIRYLERHKGVDVQAAREEIAQMAVKNGWSGGEQYGRATDAETGIVVGFNGDKNIVTTVLSEREAKVLTHHGHE